MIEAFLGSEEPLPSGARPSSNSLESIHIRLPVPRTGAREGKMGGFLRQKLWRITSDGLGAPATDD